VRGNQVFGERSGATTGITTSSSDDEFLHTDNFFPDLSDFFGNLNMGDNDAAAKYVILSSLFQFLLQFLLLVCVVDAISLSCLDVIYSSTLLVCMISLFVIIVVMIYHLLVWIISYGYLLIYSTNFIWWQDVPGDTWHLPPLLVAAGPADALTGGTLRGQATLLAMR
jgi:hypothetical protein